MLADAGPVAALAAPPLPEEQGEQPKEQPQHHAAPPAEEAQAQGAGAGAAEGEVAQKPKRAYLVTFSALRPDRPQPDLRDPSALSRQQIRDAVLEAVDGTQGGRPVGRGACEPGFVLVR